MAMYKQILVFTVPIGREQCAADPRQRGEIRVHLTMFAATIAQALEPLSLEEVQIRPMKEATCPDLTSYNMIVTADAPEDLHTEIDRRLQEAMIDAACIVQNLVDGSDTDWGEMES